LKLTIRTESKTNVLRRGHGELAVSLPLNVLPQFLAELKTAAAGWRITSQRLLAMQDGVAQVTRCGGVSNAVERYLTTVAER
jgi:hypothetical protein